MPGDLKHMNQNSEMASVSPVTNAVDPGHGRAVALLPWIVVVVGLCVMYAPLAGNLLWALFFDETSTPDQEHGPIVLCVSLFLFYLKRAEILAAREENPRTIAGWIILVIGLLFYVVGHSQGIISIEIFSGIIVLFGLGFVLFGKKAVKQAWFPYFFMLFMIPFPAGVVDAVTMPLKMAVSYGAENLLYAVGYPIARSGVILQIGQYQLLVADACAGLQTLFSLESMGLLYLNLVRHESMQRNAILAILIIPISFIANVIRVIALVLITYHFGSEASQGFLHGFAGMVLYLSALLLIIGVDSLTRKIVVRKSGEK
jgi:exosortase B